MSTRNAYLLIGGLLLLIALAGGRVARWPMSTAMIYLAIGYLLATLGWISVELDRDARWIEIASEIAVIVSLFSVGLRLRGAPRSQGWKLPALLASLGMTATVACVAAAGILLAQLPLAAAIVLGAVVAPTDPVLAGDVQLEHPDDRDPVRRTLTGEAGLNDGTAFPFLLLGLGLFAPVELPQYLLHWLALDVLWKVVGGLAIGALLGAAIARAVRYLRRRHGDALGYDDFLALGLIALTYGAAHLIDTYGFLAVFAAGWALHTEESQQQQEAPLAHSVLRFNDRMDRIAELALVLVVGALVATLHFSTLALGFSLLVLLLIRPLAVAPICALSGMTGRRCALVAWFGVRGIGSVYYLAYAITHGLPTEHIETIGALTLALIASSTLVHGVTSTPGLRRWNRSTHRASGSA